jgi:hypothetical protein
MAGAEIWCARPQVIVFERRSVYRAWLFNGTDVYTPGTRTSKLLFHGRSCGLLPDRSQLLVTWDVPRAVSTVIPVVDGQAGRFDGR